MATARDDFTAHTKQILQNRVASRCSNPSCRAVTAGPQVNPDKALNIGVAAHITAATPDGPRYDQSLTAAQRSSITNGIWLCQNCAKLVDNDPARFTVQVLHSWKEEAEEAALREMGRPSTASPQATISRPVVVLEYEVNFEETPEKPFALHNVSAIPAFEVQISSITYAGETAEFELVPRVEAHESRNVMPDLPHEGLVFRRRLRPLLDKAWHEQRWLASQGLPREKIEELFDQPIVLPIIVSYRGATRETYVEQFEVVYIYFAATAFVRFPRA